VSAGEAAPPVDLEAMDKAKLRKTIKALSGKYDEGDNEKVLRKKLKKLMAATKVLNPEAVKDVVMSLPDCFGLFLDATTTFCQKCPERPACTAKFDENVKVGFPQIRRKHVDKALDDLKKNPKGKKAVEAPATKKEAPAEEKKAKASAKTKDGKVLTFDRPIKIVGGPKDNPYKKGEDTYDLVKTVLTKKPKTIGDLVALYGSLYELPKKQSQQLAESVSMIDFLRESDILKLLKA
jgi:hypothetical protein